MESKHPTLTAVAPRDCALAFALPLTRDRFLADLADGDRKDFAGHVRETNKKQKVSDEYYWNEVYQPLASVINDICGEVQKAGVTVRLDATVNDFSQLVDQFKVVTLVTHWRFRRISPDEILDVRGFLECLEKPQNSVHQVLHSVFEKNYPDLFNRDRSSAVVIGSLQELIAEQLNGITAAAHELYYKTNIDSEGAASNDGDLVRSIERLTRVSIEEAFPTQVCKGLAIEFSDCMHSVDELINAIPAKFDGLLDLTLCNSVVLGGAVKRHRPECIVAVNRYPAQVHVRMAFYKLAIVLLGRHPAPFIDVLTRVHTQVRQGKYALSS